MVRASGASATHCPVVTTSATTTVARAIEVSVGQPTTAATPTGDEGTATTMLVAIHVTTATASSTPANVPAPPRAGLHRLTTVSAGAAPTPRLQGGN